MVFIKIKDYLFVTEEECQIKPLPFTKHCHHPTAFIYVLTGWQEYYYSHITKQKQQQLGRSKKLRLHYFNTPRGLSAAVWSSFLVATGPVPSKADRPAVSLCPGLVPRAVGNMDPQGGCSRGFQGQHPTGSRDGCKQQQT
jgi:hypothetical protein